ncbi:MAG: hemolysin family protein [Caulobacterales bacterium]
MTETSTPDPEPPSRRRAGFRARLARILLKVLGGAGAQVAAELNEREERGENLEFAQQDMILKAARFDQLKVYDVMRPRADIVAVEATSSLGEVMRIFSESQHSRLPVYRDTLDDPLGLVHVRDVLALLAPDENGEPKAKLSDRVLTRIKRDMLCVPPSMRLSALFLKMQSSRSHLALVIDEYGGTDGLVSMEDMVEQIVGEIDDEHDDQASLIQQRIGGVYDVDGRASVEALEEALGEKIVIEDHEDDIDTVAGLAVALAGRVPLRGEILHHEGGFDLEIVDADPRRVKRLRVKRLEPAPASAASST